MTIATRLDAALGKNINKICGNKFHDPAANHCAHFVSHICDLTFSFNCKQFAGGSKPGANVRVHEIFAQCPRVGRWVDADLAKTQLIFVTLASNVDIARKEMVNIPQKHIGVYHGGKVYHYSNTADQVTSESPESFLAKFQALYAGNQGLFYGWIPGENLLLDVQAEPRSVSADKKFELPDPVDGRWKARLVGEPDFFLVGKEVNDAARKYHGIFMPGASYWGEIYRAAEYRPSLRTWATLLEVTGACESENHFNLVNTYDRAKFTFGFYQLAAHTPQDNLILMFHRLAELPDFKGYFPELELRGGRLFRVDSDGGATDLEQEFTASNGERQIMLFMNYLNPQRVPIDRQEVLQAARLIHWTQHDPAARLAQVRTAADILQRKMSARYARKLPLDGKSDIVCAIVADIFHQGRSTFAAVKPLLSSADPVEALLKVNDAAWSGRNNRLRAAIKVAKDDGRLGQKHYSAATNEFV